MPNIFSHLHSEKIIESVGSLLKPGDAHPVLKVLSSVTPPASWNGAVARILPPSSLIPSLTSYPPVLTLDGLWCFRAELPETAKQG